MVYASTTDGGRVHAEVSESVTSRGEHLHPMVCLVIEATSAPMNRKVSMDRRNTVDLIESLQIALGEAWDD